MIEFAKEALKNSEDSCIIVRDGEIIFRGSGRGVKPILQTLKHNPEILENSSLADVIIGKAAAALCVLGGVSEVYGELMSETGRIFLEKHDINTSYGELVPFIKNRTENDYCPLEKSVLLLDDPHECLEAIEKKVEQLMAANAAAETVATK